MTFEVLKFTPENLERHKTALKGVGKNGEIIYTTRDRELTRHTEYYIEGLGLYRITDRWTHSHPQNLEWASNFFKQEGFDNPLHFLQEITRIYADEAGRLPTLYTHRLVRSTMTFEQALTHLKAGHKVTRTAWCTGDEERCFFIDENNVTCRWEKEGYLVENNSFSGDAILAEDWILYNGGKE